MSDVKIPDDLKQMFEESKLDTTIHVGSDIRVLIMRVARAEAALAHKEYYDAMRAREIDMSLIPEPQRPFVAALLNQRDESYTQKEETVKENNKLRGLLAAGKGDCAYCGLPAADIAKCPSGFPGCARMDDIVNAPETKLEVENAVLVMQLAAFNWKPITEFSLPKVGDEVCAYEELWAVYSVDCILESERDCAAWRRNGWTHFRAINPPQQEDTNEQHPTATV